MKNTWPLLVMLVVLVVMSVLQWSSISASILSLSAWLMMACLSPGIAGRAFDSGLIDYWIGGVVWVVAAVWLVRESRKAIRHPESRSRSSTALVESPAAGLLALSVFVSLACPLIVPLDPNTQGSLLTTRHLPPFSKGIVVEKIGEVNEETAEGLVYTAFQRARNHLLSREISVSGIVDSTAEARQPDVSEVTREVMFVLGTDVVGRDVLSRVMYGIRTSLSVGLLAAIGATLIGVLAGMIAGMFPGLVDTLLMRLTDLFLALPVLLLVIGAVAFVGQSEITLILVLCLTGWMSIARMVRGEVRVLREREFVLAARMFRLPMRRIVVRHLLPNVVPVVVTSAVLQFGNIVLAEAALGFLGLGIQPPTASLGNMMGEATAYMSVAWWVGFFPGLILAGLLIAAHHLYEDLPERPHAGSPPLGPQ